MCDTVVAFKQGRNKRSFFAKNSDRDTGELQIVHVSINPNDEFNSNPYIEAVNKYIKSSFKKLKKIFNTYNNPYKAIISRPAWIWGAEMGVNEFGLAIGNEAVFSKEKVEEDGLLGMDILRLALHNNRTADEALDFIISLIQNYNQGGDGGYSKTLKYHNSFLIKDFTKAYLLETSSKHWAVRKIESSAAISNVYSIKDDFDYVDEDSKDIKNFKAKYEKRLFTFFTKGDLRQKFSSTYLHNTYLDLASMKNLLRSHINPSNKIKRGMGSICIHPGYFIKTETTSSMIVDYIHNKFVIWFTGAPHPCVSLFKPLVLPQTVDGKLRFSDMNFVTEYSEKLRHFSKKIVKDYDFFLKHIKPLRDKVETRFIKIIYENIENKRAEELIYDCEKCFMLEEDYIEKVEGLLH